MSQTSRRALLSLALGLGMGESARSEPVWPDRPIHIVVPFPAGGAGDIVMRLLAQELTPLLGQSVLVESRSGAAGNIGSDYVAHAHPDGYTLLMANVAPMAVNVSLFSAMPYDPVTSFAAISPVATFPNVLVVPPSLGVSTVAELIALGRSKPDRLTYASTGAGSITHLSAEMFASATGITMVHAAFRGGGPSLVATAGGQVDLYFGALPGALPYVSAGKLRALAVTSAHRSQAAPEIPTLAESGLPGFDATTWIGLVAPAGVAAAIVDRLNHEVTGILLRPDIQQHLSAIGADVWTGTPQAFADYIRTEITRWAVVVKRAGITMQ